MGKFEQLDFAKRVTIQTYLDEEKLPLLLQET